MRGSEEGNRWKGMGLFSEMPGRGDVQGTQVSSWEGCSEASSAFALKQHFQEGGLESAPLLPGHGSTSIPPAFCMAGQDP